MKRIWRRMLSICLTAALLLTTLPMGAMAALLDNTPAYNQEILEELSRLCGSEDEAERYYALMEQYGLLDEDGGAMDQWTVTLDGEAADLADIRAALAEPDCDLTRRVTVDGAAMPLGDLKTILEIEDYLAYLRETYFDGHRWTEEQQASLRSLAEQIDREGIRMLGLGTGADTVGPSGVDHAARVSVAQTGTNGNTVTFTATLTGAAVGQEVSFDWAALSGSQPVSGGETVTLIAGSDGTANEEFKVTLNNVTMDMVRSSAKLVYIVSCFNIENALFEGNQDVLDVICTAEATVDTMPSGNFIKAGTGKVISEGEYMPGIYEPYICELTEEERRAIEWGITDTVDVSPDFMVDENATEIGVLLYGDLELSIGKTTFSDVVTRAESADLRRLLMRLRKIEYQVTSGQEILASGSASWDFSDNWNKNIIKDTLVSDRLIFTASQDTSRTIEDASKIGTTLTLTGKKWDIHACEFAMIADNEHWNIINDLVLWNSLSAFKVEASFSSKRASEVQDGGVTAPAGTYHAGQIVPVTVAFSKPVEAGTATAVINGQTVRAAETGGASNVLTFPYTVQEADNTVLAISSVTATDTAGHTCEPYNPGGNTGTGLELSGVTLKTPTPAHAITDVSAQVDQTDVTAPELVVTVTLSDNEKLIDWLKLTEKDGSFVTSTEGGGSLYVSMDNGVTRLPLTAESEQITGGTLTARFPLALNTGTDPVTRSAELFLSEELVVGRLASASQAAVRFLTDADLKPTLSVKDSAGENYQYADETRTIYLQDAPQISAGFGEMGSGFTFGDTGKVTTYYKTDGDGQVPVDPAAHFVWWTSDLSVANIDSAGKITPTGKSGSVTVSLTALNGGVEGRAATAEAGTLTFGTGLTPFLQIPNKRLDSVGGQDVTVYWTSNLCDKNGETPTAFTVTLKRGEQTVELPNSTVTGTAAAPAASFTIPGGLLAYDYQGGVNTFTVTVSAVFENKTYQDAATISLESKPAVVSFGRLGSYYITDDQKTVSIPWSVTNLDRAENTDLSALFKFQVTRNSDEVKTSLIPELADGAAGGNYVLDIADVIADSDPTSYRDVYTVTIQAKNGADSTWSYDSFLLYVYDGEALRIMVDGLRAGEGLTLSNVKNAAAGAEKPVSEMSQEEILALKRDIYLKNIISVNYGEYAWSEVADQIAWKTSAPAVASLNYQQGTLYEDLSRFSYASYRPTTALGLSGLSDGTATVTATHKLTGMTDALDVTVETLKDRLYLFQCYPQARTTLTFEVYTDEARKETRAGSVVSEDNGGAAYYAPFGIASDVYAQAKVDGNLYTGTFYRSALKTGEGDWTKLERYPCNNLELRRAAYAYLYLKNPDGTPYTGEILFRGGVYVNGAYKQDARFALNGGAVDKRGDVDSAVKLGGDGRLEVLMDQTQWDLPGGAIQAGDRVSYVFQIEQSGSTEYYPMLVEVNAGQNQAAYVGSGEAVASFRENGSTGEHPFIAYQVSRYEGYDGLNNVLDATDAVGPSDSLPEASLTTVVMWWGVEKADDPKNTLQLYTADTRYPIADGQGEHSLTNTGYPFSDLILTTYTVKLNKDTLAGKVAPGRSAGLVLDYYGDGSALTRQEPLSFKLRNMIGKGKAEEAKELYDMLSTMGNASGTSAKAEKSFGDQFVDVALNLAAGDTYTKADGKAFQIQLAPTADPSKFLGFIQVNVGNMENNVTGVYGEGGTGKVDSAYKPGLSEMMMLTGMKSPFEYAQKQMEDYNKARKEEGVRNLSFQLGGYAEALIYYDENDGKWAIQILNGGFKVAGGTTYTWSTNVMCGPIPFTTSLSIGGTVAVGMDALSVAYYDTEAKTYDIGNDFLTELRIYLYLRFFAGVGFDYSIVAFKLGIYGQLNIDAQFRWLNRPYMDNQEEPGKIVNVADGTKNDSNNAHNLNGQNFKLDGQIGLEFLFKLLFISYEKILYSKSFTVLNESTNEWDEIESSWAANQQAQQNVIGGLLKSGAISTYDMGGQQMLALNLAPTVESRDYLDQGGRRWGDGGFSLFSLDRESALKNLESNTYPYANPMVSDDGQIVAYLSDQNSGDAEQTHAAYSILSDGAYLQGQIIPDGAEAPGYGDSQLSLSGTKDFAAAAWTRQTVSLRKDAGAVLTNEDQMMMLNGTEAYASIYSGGAWTTTALSGNSAPDLAPVAAAAGNTALVAWRSVAASGKTVDNEGTEYVDLASFDQKDAIVYKIYQDGEWSGVPLTLYNGTSGAVKGISAAMLSDGSAAAVAYTLDQDGEDSTTTDREIVYAVVDTGTGEVVRTVRATNDGYLDENPQLSAVTFPGQEGERFVLGWYTEQAVTSDAPAVLDGGGEAAAAGETGSDIRLLEFDALGNVGQRLPDSISQVADSYGVSITSSFRFTKNADSINDLSILWVERAEGTSKELSGNGGGSSGENGDLEGLKAERDVLKGVKFYTYGLENELIRFTGAVDVAEMGESTLIDHFDAYVSDPATNEIKAVILGTTYGAGGNTRTKVVTLADGEHQAQVTVPARQSGLYTATETYADKIEVPARLADYDTIKRGGVTQIQFTVDNKGIHAISTLEFKVGDTLTTYDGLNLLPGDSIQLYADYQVPADKVVDPDYTVTATFDESTGAAGAADTGARAGFLGLGAVAGSNVATGTINLDVPDLAVTSAQIVGEQGGKRTILVKLNNGMDAALQGSNRSVKLGFYTDATCEMPFDDAVLPAVTISSDGDLKMIDEGGYAKTVTFDVGGYMTDGEGTVREIPASGVAVYLKAEVLDDEGQALGEPNTADNHGSVTAENLALRKEQDVSVSTAVDNSGGVTRASVDIQYNKLLGTVSGNLILTLRDEEGTVLEQVQSYTGEGGDNGLLTLAGEETAHKDVSFTKKGSYVQVLYSDLILEGESPALDSLTFSNIPGITLDSFVDEGDGVYRAAVSTDDLTATAVTAVAKSAKAVISVRGSGDQPRTGGNTLGETLPLIQGETNTITVTVTVESAVATFVLTVQNNGEPVMEWPDDGNAREEAYGTAVYYGADHSATVNLRTVTLEPGRLSYQWYSCGVDGLDTVAMEDQTGSTLNVDGGTDAGLYYYRCKVTRTLVDGKTRDYWSSVATVQIHKAADGNAVTLTGTEATFDGKPHRLTQAAAVQDGSTLHYSTDKGAAWSETPPAFTAVGVHTVWVYATHRNYEDTGIVTADVTIREKEGTRFKLETQDLSDAFAGYPAKLREQYQSAQGMEAALKTEVTALGVPEENTAVYDVKLLFSLDEGSTWTQATADNFPAAGVTVELAYPEDTDRSRYNFTLLHLVTDPLGTGKQVGEIETMDITLEEEGVRFTADCLSPFVLGWSLRPTSGKKYPVAVRETPHGSVSVRPASAYGGSTVTVTAEPDEGYRVERITVTTQTGRTLTATDKGAGVYTFKMPSSAVSVQAAFAPLAAACDGGADCPGRAFSDLASGAWYHEAVDYVLAHGVMSGYGSGRFGPGDVLSRGMLAQILYNQEGRPAVSDGSLFADVERGAWYADAVAWAGSRGVMNGYGSGRFGPDDPVTREQMAVVLHHWARLAGGVDASGGDLSPFPDRAGASSWALEALAWAVGTGLMKGKGDGTLAPGGSVTRAEAAAMLSRYMQPGAA